MNTPKTGSRGEWLAARLALLAREKELNRLRDELAVQRRALPWVRVDEEYSFDGSEGRVRLADLFDGRGQLLVYHFMYGPGWDEGCPSCSFWADTFEGLDVHLAHRDVSFVCVSRAPLADITSYRARMGWTFPWYSSEPSDFNFDFGVSFTPNNRPRGRPTTSPMRCTRTRKRPVSARSLFSMARSSTPTPPTAAASTR